MLDKTSPEGFPPINRAYNRVFQPRRLSLGLVLPLEAFSVGATPSLQGHIETAQLAERLGFSALWLRDVPFNVPAFGDPGQIFDPFVYLGLLAAVTDHIALGTASVILPLRHPAHVAKAAATADQFSGGRLLLGVASGDRPEEYPALNRTYPDRGTRFRDSFAYIRAAAAPYPRHTGLQGHLTGDIDLLPKPTGPRLPLLITGRSQQPADWAARNGDGWITYPRDPVSQGRSVSAYRQGLVNAGEPDKPVVQSLYVDLLEDPDAPPQPIHLGFRSGTVFLHGYLKEIEQLGINHAALNLRFNQASIETTLNQLADTLLPDFDQGTIT
ncbi:TIGR03571 family LLM class oxidoreductase [Roseibium sp. RKSG952]|uniref:TIGR03571 family LLM class oxidoreductase n=1 Tax=Roseibium sp. RKSG952 TaxID=2529384 RepID=UPI0012BC345C|nr:TIGR03571 family LLM class oxidoreductase [Roseibium sp. RKSG952]MTH98206.1 TIGR03571 family LLM class oxidoreductase [Roseibium sp. RKSG952]